MKTKVYIDGSEGTTGLRINERFKERDDIEILKISSELRKDINERKRLINESDITFLCLPDMAAREAVSLVENENVIIIDASTAHRTEENWAYGFPELSEEFRESIKSGKRIAVPGCHATGFVSMVYPLIREGIMSKDYPVTSFSLTGYSGGGNKMIDEYEALNREEEYDAPRVYALNHNHKHLKEMKLIGNLDKEPLFTPIVSDYYSGMTVCLPLYRDLLSGKQNVESIHSFFSEYYKNAKFVRIMPIESEKDINGFLSGNRRSGWDGLDIFVTGNEERIMVSASFDNLGKGASGAAIQCMNIVLGCEEEKGLTL